VVGANVDEEDGVGAVEVDEVVVSVGVVDEDVVGAAEEVVDAIVEDEDVV